MTISYVSGNSSTGNTTTMSAHAAGDLLIAFAFRDGNTTSPTVPAGWTTIGAPIGSNVCSWLPAFKIAANSSETTGTWTNATGVSVAVYRKSATGVWLNPYVNWRTGTGNLLDYTIGTTFGVPDAISQRNTDRWYLRCAGHRTATDLITNTPAGWTFRTGTATESRIMDTNGSLISLPDSIGGNTQSVNASSGWVALGMVIEEWDGTGIVCVGCADGQLSSPSTPTLQPLPQHQAGDLFLMWAFNGGSTTPPTLASGWTSLASGGANGVSGVLAYKIATTNAEAYGTWVSATGTVLAIYRSELGTWSVIDSPAAANSGSSATINLSSSGANYIPGNYVEYVRFAGMATSVWSADPINWLNRVYGQSGTTGWVVMWDDNGPVLVNADSIGGNSLAIAASTGWRAITARIASLSPQDPTRFFRMF